ncbi:MAG: guanylate kinase [Agathobacter sp.]|uniref:5' nucleotidase, NT5C type n=1 Tax=Agathobacter sp. TaxID=2021311 RepID=UPI00257F5B84|nr:guanylate kinase [Agathobacter sp.]MBQ1681852.1 guanylate kinase [Agathobacter sp.]
MLRPKIGLDWDDVTAPFNDIAIEMANEKYQFDPPLTLGEITSWANTGRASVIKEFYGQEALYERQTVPQENKKMIEKLMEIADVYFITAAYPQFMGIRAKQILDAFPDFPPENIILGNAKNLVQFDIILDDAIHNVLESPAAYPVLMRKPWNWKMTGLLSVNSMKEFVSLVEQIMLASHTKVTEIQAPAVLALVGPSGSGKTHLSNSLCVDPRFENPRTYCTKRSHNHRYLSEKDFAKQNFIEQTQYAGVKYGTKKEDIQSILDQGKFAVMPLDMCGAIAMKQHFKTAIIYLNRDKEILIHDILKEDYTIEEKTLRILSIDAEKRNREICDFVINNDKEDALEQVIGLTVGTMITDGGFFSQFGTQ